MPNAIPNDGRRAPSFTLASTSGENFRLADYKHSYLVLYFYPKDATSGCTTEAQQFRDALPAFRSLRVDVFGISPDSLKSHAKFRAKEKLTFHLLADIDHKVAEKYGLWVEKSMYGRKFWGVQRATFLIGPGAKICTAWPKVTPNGHAKEVLAALQKIRE